MAVEFIRHNWAVLAASVLGLGILLFVAFRAFEDSARGRLMRLVRAYDQKVLAAQKAQKVSSTAVARLQKMHARRDSAIPKHIQKAAEALEDARALLKIADDQVLIAANHVRKTILEEFPPRQHERLRARYLPEKEPSEKPFTF